MTMTADSAPEFDTLAYARKLEAAGVEREQARAHADATRDNRAGLATKRDLRALKAGIEADLAALETRLVKIIFGVAAGQAAVIVALLKLLE